MNIQTFEHGDCIVVQPNMTRIDHTIANRFRDLVFERATLSRRTVVLDLSTVEFIDSSGLGAIMGLRKRLGWSVRIVLAGLKSPVYRVFEMARVTQVFTFYTSVDAAVGRTIGDSAPWDKPAEPAADTGGAPVTN
ncbi:MAG: STAS domain-containing protein [Pseudomonadota bacterium]